MEINSYIVLILCWIYSISYHRTVYIATYQESFDFQELHRPSEAAKHVVSKRCKDLANFMESLMEEVNRSHIELDLPQEVNPTVSVSLKNRVSVCFLFYLHNFVTENGDREKVYFSMEALKFYLNHCFPYYYFLNSK